MNTTYEILVAARAEMLNCKRNKSGSVNGNAIGAIKKRYAARLMAECGEERGAAIWMMHDLAKIALK